MEVSMEKKNGIVKAVQLPSKSVPEATYNKEYANKRNGSRTKKREFDKAENGKKLQHSNGRTSGYQTARCREKTSGGKVAAVSGTSKADLLYESYSKKQNITHLMNWWEPRRQFRNLQDRGDGKRSQHYNSSYMPKYCKELFLQANCQFVVIEGADYSVHSIDPDLLVDWEYIQEVRLHVSQEPFCPICLYPPTAPKVTRCGHIYCYACILHYLALSDKKWRSCPICYEAVCKDDLRSATAICHREFSPGDDIEMYLMQRDKDSIVPIPVFAYTETLVKDAMQYNNNNAATPFVKLVLASRQQVKDFIIGREISALETQFEVECDQPESCFIQEALSLCLTRITALDSNIVSLKHQTSEINTQATTSMTEEVRNRMRFLRHLPLSCVFDMVELNIGIPLLSKLTLAEFQFQLEARCRNRNRKAKQEKKIEYRNKVQEDRLYGRSKSHYVPLESLEHFPAIFNEEDFGPSLCSEDIQDNAEGAVACEILTPPVVEAMSFAQITREGSSNVVKQCVNKQIKQQNFEFDDAECTSPPDFNLSFSEGIAEALESPIAKEAFAAKGNCKGKNKKKKRVILFSSGGVS